MHLLWLKTELLHPVDKGGRIRTYQMLRMLKREHRITYLTLDDGQADPDAIARATEYSDRVVTVPHRVAARHSLGFLAGAVANLASSLPYAIARSRSPAFRRKVAELTRNGGIEVVVCDFLVSALNFPAEVPCPAVLFQHNIEAEIWRRRAEVATNPLARAYFANQRDRMIAFEAKACRRFDRVVAVSKVDAAHFERAYGATDVEAVPTGVDTEYFRSFDPAARRPGSLVFVGSMDWAPNEDAIRYFVSEVLPAVRARVPGVTLTVVGRDPGPGIRALAVGHPGVTVTGTVPDVRPFLASAAAMVVPLRVGGGTRLKIFEAMATETPVVSTSIGAEGLPLTPGEHVLIGDSPDELARATIRVLEEPDLAARMAAASAALVRSQFGWDAAARAFAAVCEDVRARRQSTFNQDIDP